ncbi:MULTISPECIES: TetR/AcrR family transcriptional regulator [Catenuloplanes]|uniref:AcrR family transcriptional regulator n=1 Tax=Catenuloplanes niger TaxID=587534 RepID=A0AAE4CPN2_9ACTN|nr:TetR/AcrR family transcriptional regulator [Catenuloplanes niger]MDR7320125.1 AcrR family transcriptional regulator [Catenuloplanes niger]
MDDDKRRRILDVTAGILESGGAQAVSTRSVAAAAGIRAASLYQLFGDMDGLLTALARHVFDLYLAEKRTLTATDDPVDDLRRGWDMHVSFGLRHPAFYLLMFGPPRPGRRPPAVDQAYELLLRYMERVAATGRLRVPTTVAADLALAGGIGATLTLIGGRGDGAAPGAAPIADVTGLSERMRDSLLGAVLTGAPATASPGLAPLAVALDTALAAEPPETLRPTETALLRDWLGRLAG